MIPSPIMNRFLNLYTKQYSNGSAEFSSNNEKDECTEESNGRKRNKKS